MTTYLVTGSSGHLGRPAINRLATLANKSEIIALARSDAAAAAYADKGIVTRSGDLDDLTSLTDAFAGVDRLLLISSSEIGKRKPQGE